MPPRTLRSLRGACLVLVLLGAMPVAAHHILGIPHYAYDEQYPQTPVLTYRVEAGAFDVKMTGYPGMPRAGERCTLHVDIRDRESGEPLAGFVTLSVTRDRVIGEDPLVYGPVRATVDERVFKFFPEFPLEADYQVRIEFSAGGEPWRIDLPMVVGEPGSPWLVVGGVAAAVGLFLIVVRAARIKMARRTRSSRPPARRLPEVEASTPA